MPEMKIKPKFEIGQAVWLKSDDEQFERQVVGILITPIGLEYKLRYADMEPTTHTHIEILEAKRVY